LSSKLSYNGQLYVTCQTPLNETAEKISCFVEAA